MEQAARHLQFGRDWFVHFELLEEVRKSNPYDEHGLRLRDITTADAMNVPRWYRICNPKLDKFLDMMENEGKAVKGTR